MRYETASGEIAAARATGSGWSRALLLYAVFVVLLPLLFSATARSMATTWWYTTAFNHCALVPLASLYLAWRQRATLAFMTPRHDLLGLPLVAGCVLGWLAGRAGEVMLVQQLALVGLLVALFVAIFGRRIAWQLAFPLGFLVLMVPFGEGLIPPLQDFTADFAVWLLRLLDVPVFREGILLAVPSGLFEVAEACAGLRFLIANIVIALLFAHLVYQRAWKWALFLTLAVVVPIIANGLRATGIIYIAYVTDNEYAAGVDHIVYGWGFFTAVMLLLLLVGNLFADPPVRPGPPVPARLPIGRSPGLVVPLLAFLLVLAGPAYAAAVMRLPERVPALVAPSAMAVPGWSEAAAGSWRPVFSGADLLLERSYAREAAPVDLAIGYYAFQRAGAELVQNDHSLAGDDWRRLGSGEQLLQVPGLPTTLRREQLTSVDQLQRRVVLSWYWIGGRFTANRYEALALQALDRLLGRNGPAAILAVSTLEDGDPAAAIARLERFLAAAPWGSWLEAPRSGAGAGVSMRPGSELPERGHAG